jgi:hypothetical protein
MLLYVQMGATVDGSRAKGLVTSWDRTPAEAAGSSWRAKSVVEKPVKSLRANTAHQGRSYVQCNSRLA